MNFELEKPIEELLPKQIGFNAEEMKPWIEEAISKYQGMIVTADTIKEAKDDRAKLNKLRNSIEDERKRIKRMWNEPYKDFEKEVKSLVSLIDKPIENIDRQLKTYEEHRKQEKRETIQGLFDEHVSELKELINLDQIANPKWLNASYNIGAIENEIVAALDDIRSNRLLIPDICPGKVREAAKQKALEKKTQTEEKSKEASNMQPVPKAQREAKAATIQVDFRVWATKAQLQAIKAFLKAQNIKYGRVQ